MDMTYWIKGLLRMFYIVTPSEYNAEVGSSTLKEIWPFFLLFILLENAALYAKTKSFQRLNDGVTSIAHGVFYESARIVTRGAENWMYLYIYENHRVIDLKWNSPFTWYAVAIAVDFGYYWMHRASHEIHILWAHHQVHHSSEDFNMIVGLRQPFLYAWCAFIFYLPMAFFVPPVQFLIHQKFNLIYQFWVHTCTIDRLGPVEYVFNTPNHHRVHHGSNIRYLDKNYGGVLIIWDRLFGTFAEHSPKQEITFGLVAQPRTFNPLYQQVFFFKMVYMKWERMQDWSNKIQSLFKGPSWQPGSPWTGRDEDKINVQYRQNYDPQLRWPCKLYLSLHMAVCLCLLYQLPALAEISIVETYLCVMYILGSVTVFGMFFDQHPKAVVIEIVRCCFANLSIACFRVTLFANWGRHLCVFYGASALIWMLTYTNKSMLQKFLVIQKCD